jgi:hypothetical protein
MREFAEQLEGKATSGLWPDTKKMIPLPANMSYYYLYAFGAFS